jgi:hypothetical protein
MSFSQDQEIQGHRSNASCSDSPSLGIKSPSLFLSSGNLPGWLCCSTLCLLLSRLSFLFALLVLGRFRSLPFVFPFFPAYQELEQASLVWECPLIFCSTTFGLCGLKTWEKFPICYLFCVCMLCVTWLYVPSEDTLEKPGGHRQVRRGWGNATMWQGPPCLPQQPNSTWAISVAMMTLRRAVMRSVASCYSIGRIAISLCLKVNLKNQKSHVFSYMWKIDL